MDLESPEIEANFNIESPLKESSDDQDELQRIEQREQKNTEFLQDLKSSSQKSKPKPKPSIQSKMEELLEQAETYATFLLSRTDTRKMKGRTTASAKKRRTSYEEDDSEGEVEGNPTRLFQQPSSLQSGQLKEFQLYGLNWMIALFETGINGILADEMGLGKTIQTIALISFLREFKHIHGPFLIVGPKSTLGNWYKEFQKWLPNCRVLKLLATKDEREDILKNHLLPNKFDVCLTSFEGISICRNQLLKFKWKYIIIDEAHRIKNEESLLSNVIGF